MQDAERNDQCAIDDWMIELLEDDRPSAADEMHVSNGLHWMYRASLLRWN
jgi:hypothetical protein